MRVTGALSFEQYWADARFQVKKPNLCGSKKQAFGDNIYSRSKSGLWLQANSHHSLTDGCPNQANVVADTATNRVLLSNDFVYWGGYGPRIPQKFLNYGPRHLSLCAGRNHKNNFPADFVNEFVGWIRFLNTTGYVGEPFDWRKSP
jgi:hypothetical protein